MNPGATPHCRRSTSPTAGKLFAGFPVLHARVALIVMATLLFTPAPRRAIHRFHWDRKV